ncbi:MAG TPA: MoaD/ThiS family protein [Dehalococcoidia bacterium]|nr:MoaD/ThiS family protein [Dehalococcoidia bacterium]
MALEVRLYGKLRRFAAKKEVSSDSLIMVELPDVETVQGVLERIGVAREEVSNVFLNGRLAGLEQQVKDGDRLGLFPPDMSLLYC